MRCLTDITLQKFMQLSFGVSYSTLVDAWTSIVLLQYNIQQVRIT